MKNRFLNELSIVLVLGIIVIFYYLFNQQDKNLKVVFCDVGQGDAILVQFGKDEEVLIDAGPNNSVMSCLGSHMAFYDRKISAVFLTHLDADHITGILDILKTYEVGEIYLSNTDKDSQIFKKIQENIIKKQIPNKVVYQGQNFTYGNYSIETLYPEYQISSLQDLESNEYSLVLKLTDNQVDFLFTGDINKKISEKVLNQNRSKLKSEVLKIPHHGSKDFSVDFIKAVNPEISIISVGKKNRFGHPSKEVLDFLNLNKFDFLRTDEAGEVVIESDGENWRSVR